MRTASWSVVVPVKPLSEAKSRLRGALTDERHEQLVLALVSDTVGAVVACPEVTETIVVCDDPPLRSAVRALGARAVPDVAGDLNAAIRHGAGCASAGNWLAALTGDLPALRPRELSAALQACAGVPERHFVPDATGSGTVLLAGPPGVPLDPRFGVGSAAAHSRSGAHRLNGDWPGLRRDVDVLTDLAEAATLGLGAHTAALLACGRAG